MTAPTSRRVGRGVRPGKFIIDGYTHFECPDSGLWAVFAAMMRMIEDSRNSHPRKKRRWKLYIEQQVMEDHQEQGGKQ